MRDKYTPIHIAYNPHTMEEMNWRTETIDHLAGNIDHLAGNIDNLVGRDWRYTNDSFYLPPDSGEEKEKI